jgi:hypothetical protein
MTLAVTFLILATIIMVLAYNLPRSRGILLAAGFYALMSGVFASYSNWLPQVRGEVPKEAEPVAAGDIESMSPEKLAEMGEIIIFGKVVSGNPVESDVGKGQCPLCHRVSGTNIRDRAPDLTAKGEGGKPIGDRAAVWVKSDVYRTQKASVAEAFPGSGRATSGPEYIAESHACPSCFVVPGFGEKGTNDTVSPMPPIHKPPIALSIEELIAVDTYLYVKDGITPPSPGEIRAAYEKFIPEKERAKAAPAATQASAPAGGLDAAKIALPGDTPEQIIQKMQCFVCHKIPTVAIAKIGVIGPMLIEKTNAPKRIASAEYQARVKAGKAHAKSPKEYIMESIVNPNAFVVEEFRQKGNPDVSPMIQDFGQKFTYEALNKLADFLLTLDEAAAQKDGMMPPKATEKSNETDLDRHAASDVVQTVEVVSNR